MSNANHCSTTVLKVALMLAAAAAFSIPMWGQEAPAITVGNVQITGLPDDWTHHHVVFSDPGSADDAIQNGTYERWFSIVNDPRYVMQQIKRGLPAQGSAAVDAAWIEGARREGREPGVGLGCQASRIWASRLSWGCRARAWSKSPRASASRLKARAWPADSSSLATAGSAKAVSGSKSRA